MKSLYQGVIAAMFIYCTLFNSYYFCYQLYLMYKLYPFILLQRYKMAALQTLLLVTVLLATKLVVAKNTLKEQVLLHNTTVRELHHQLVTLCGHHTDTKRELVESSLLEIDLQVLKAHEAYLKDELRECRSKLATTPPSFGKNNSWL